jgi:chromosome segregation protein
VVRNERELTEGLQELRMALAVERRSREAAEEQQQPMEARIRELRELRGRCEAEIAGFEERIAAAVAEDGQLAVACEAAGRGAAELGRQLDELAASRPGLDAAIAEAERVLDDLRREIARAAEARGRDEVELTKHELRLENLVGTTRERHQVELDSFEPDAHALLACIRAQQKAAARRAARAAAAEGAEGAEGADAGEAPEGPRRASCRRRGPAAAGRGGGRARLGLRRARGGRAARRLEAKGPVNVDAIEEFEELEERHQFLRGQHDDLVRAKAELLDVIGRIDVETRRRFAETFAQVRENFRRMFRELFGADGKADLLLVDESDPLESGIEVIAKPPGKKLQSITLLSGGERSMTAVALLFSIYLIKPSPFCVLDELDAPLDEATSGASCGCSTGSSRTPSSSS